MADEANKVEELPSTGWTKMSMGSVGDSGLSYFTFPLCPKELALLCSFGDEMAPGLGGSVIGQFLP